MTQEERPLYGELVPGLAGGQEESTAEQEVHEMEAQVRRMIEVAAYYLAERRGFHSGYEMQDWLRAEQQVREQLGLDK